MTIHMLKNTLTSPMKQMTIISFKKEESEINRMINMF